MNYKALGLAALISASSVAVVSGPAFAWDKQFCESGAAGKETSNPAAGQEAIAWCQYNFPNVTPAPTLTATGGSATANQHQNQHQSQQQNQSLNNRLNQSLSNSGNSYTNVRETGQLPMVNAPDCGGINAGVSADLQGEVALSAAVHFGRKPDSCVHYAEVAQAAPVVYVQPTVPVSVAVAAPAPQIVHTESVRTVYVSHGCPVDVTRGSDLAYLHAHRSQMHRKYSQISWQMKAVARRLCIPDDAFVGLDG